MGGGGGSDISISCIYYHIVLEWGRWGWMGTGGDGGRYGGHLASVWESLKKRKTRTAFCICFFFYQNKSRFFFFFFFFFFSPLWLAGCLSLFTLSSFSTTNVGAVQTKKKKKSSCFWSNQSRRRLLSLWCHQQLPTCQLAHKTGMWPASTCWVDCRGTSCWRNPLAAACHFPVLPAWGDTEACKLPGHLGLLEYMLQCFPMTAGPSAE